MSVFAMTTIPCYSSQGSDTLLPTKYLEFEDIFNKSKASTFPDHHSYDCPIDLQPKKKPPWGLIYNLSPSELKAHREYINNHLANGLIRHSKSPNDAPIFFVNKKGESLWCSDLNQQTISSWYATMIRAGML